jgi:hypothetical protein
LVNVDRVKRKLPGLLVNGSTTKRKGWNELMRNRYRLQQFQKLNPQRFNSLTNDLIVVLEKIDQALKT